MILFKKRVNYEDIYKEVLSAFFLFLHKENEVQLSSKGMSELLRYTMCNLMGLQSIYADEIIKDLSDKLSPDINVVLNKHNVYDTPIKYRQGLLEACVHCIEISRSHAGL